MGGDDLRSEIARIRQETAAASDHRLNKLQEQIQVLMQEHDDLQDKYDTLERKHGELTQEHAQSCKRRKCLEEEVTVFMRKERAALGVADRERRDKDQAVKKVEERDREVCGLTKRAREAEEQCEVGQKKLKTVEKSERELEAANRRLRKEMADMVKSKDAML